MKTLLTLLILLVFFIPNHSVAITNVPQSIDETNLRTQRTHFYSEISKAIEANRDELVEALNEIGTVQGANYEIEQALKTLRNAPEKELANFSSIQNLKKMAIYGSSNIPLYTIVLQIFIPSVVFDKVVFKISSKTKNVYQKIWKILDRSLVDKFGLSKKVEFVVSNKKDGIEDYMMSSILGKTRDQTAADVVVFTGNPQNGDQLVQQINDKIADSKLTQHKILFMKFGAGMNPIVVDQSVQASQINQIIETSLEHFKINSGQDCISPNFSLLPINYKDQASSQFEVTFRV